jgi:hypothetical protein
MLRLRAFSISVLKPAAMKVDHFRTFLALGRVTEAARMRFRFMRLCDRRRGSDLSIVHLLLFCARQTTS